MKVLWLILSILATSPILAQQIADTTYQPPLPRPAYTLAEGSVVFIDEGHHNFHTKTGRYRAFADLLERDGYITTAYQGKIERQKLDQGKILVISNALHPQNTENWHKPVLSAFTTKEIQILSDWVADGGALFLIADHMPMGGAAQQLAAAFGFQFTDGFVFNTITRGPTLFGLEDGSLRKNPITQGRDSSERVERIATFTGQGFQLPEDAQPILVFGDHFVNLLPDTAWVFNDQTQRINATGWSQGAYKQHGKGRVVAFGEAAMFTAQLAGPERRKTGMSNPIAPENYQLLLNIIHWLDGLL